MKIGAYVKQYLPKVFRYCDVEDHSELEHLLDRKYSKKKFGLNYPFCEEVSRISDPESKRYWTDIHVVRGKSVRATSQWFDSSRELFSSYLLEKRIVSIGELPTPKPPVAPIIPKSKSRYKGSAIGNSQNHLIRNLLSNLGEESFSEGAWVETNTSFGNRCAYCGSEGKLVMDHAIPINRKSLGEHRLGNLIPSCTDCNQQKGDRDFRTFLVDKLERIAAIERHMDSKNYVPLGDNDQVRMILELAHKEVDGVATRYLTILNSLFSRG